MRLGTDEALDRIRSNKTYIPILMKAFNFDAYSQRDGSNTNYNTNSTRAATGAYVVSSDAGMEAEDMDMSDEHDGESASEGLDADGDGVMLHSSSMDATSAVEVDAESEQRRREQLTQEISAHLSQSNPNIIIGDKRRNSDSYMMIYDICYLDDPNRT
jgi:hypothetical protein